ncbi:unnamed protein product [Protopolystoma xenopodis]|uniref:Uncharacterized protein n=1 Tax=Protopolystoma xenopodis TaxID=117903 RepID=A0A448WNT4_9PLAT|nr:unnamed protein product [Protopolystoma xenopodis]
MQTFLTLFRPTTLDWTPVEPICPALFAFGPIVNTKLDDVWHRAPTALSPLYRRTGEHVLFWCSLVACIPGSSGLSVHQPVPLRPRGPVTGQGLEGQPIGRPVSHTPPPGGVQHRQASKATSHTPMAAPDNSVRTHTHNSSNCATISQLRRECA